MALSAMVNARPQKRSLTLHGHRTSVSLEEPFWRAFLKIAEDEGKTINGLAAEIDDARRGSSGLATAIRLYVLAALQVQLSEAITCSEPS
ncbi:MAG: ribbon-helix-helix domain-containing protein [Methylococcales bacterium]|nr:ribbon-helix-helix domain-containing protein [Methylococcales bacterium]